MPTIRLNIQVLIALMNGNDLFVRVQYTQCLSKQSIDHRIDLQKFSVSTIGCKDAINCAGESLTVSIEISPDGSDPNLIEFDVNYSGDYQIEDVDYDFGDGTKANGESPIITHRYSAPGTYDVTILVNLKDGKDRCMPEYDRKVVID